MSGFEASLRDAAEATLSGLRERLSGLHPRVRVAHVGRIVEVGDGVATATGLDEPVAGELLDVAGVPARADVVARDVLRLVLLGAGVVEAGAPVRRQGRVLDVPAGEALIGRIVDAVGRPLDGEGPLHATRRVVVDGPPLPLREREPVSRPLHTGIFVVDTMIPVGRGQRQLVIGDRSTGKSELCLDILAAQGPDVIGVYVGIGRRGAEVSGHLAGLRQAGFFRRGFAVIAASDAPIGLVHLAPYTAFAIAEDLMLQGRDVLVVLDDLTTHAHAHRTLALLLGRPVGREAFPVDVFYAHARLLERATQLGARRGGGSLTALPIVETQSGDLAAYIPTNLVSITDGQIRTDVALVARHQNPAVDVGLSVSRVGGKAQPEVLRRIVGRVKNDYAQFLELENFTRFGAQLEASTQRVIAWGVRTRAMLAQDRGRPVGWDEAIVRLLALGCPEVVDVPLPAIREAGERALARCREQMPEAMRRLVSGRDVSAEELAALRGHVAAAITPLLPAAPSEAAE